MSRSVKKVLIQALAAAVFMVVVTGVSIYTATAGVDPKTFPPVYAENQTAYAGRRVFQRAGCASCHQLMRQGGNSRDLTEIGRQYDRVQLAKIIRNPDRYLSERSADLMPEFSKKDLSEKDLETLTKYLATLK